MKKLIQSDTVECQARCQAISTVPPKYQSLTGEGLPRLFPDHSPPTSGESGQGKGVEGEEQLKGGTERGGEEEREYQQLRLRKKWNGEEQLRERDYRVLSFLYEHQILKFEQLSRFFFGSNNGVAGRRLRFYKLAGIVRHQTVGGLGREPRVLRLTQKGQKLAEARASIRIQQRKSISSVSLFHDSMVAELRAFFQMETGAAWIPEAALKEAGLKQIPDGVLVFKGNRQVAIEFENTIKSMRRYRSIVEDYQTSTFQVVLYVLSSWISLDLFRAKWRSIPQSNRCQFYFISFKSLEGSSPLAFSVNGKVPLRSVLGVPSEH